MLNLCPLLVVSMAYVRLSARNTFNRIQTAILRTHLLRGLCEQVWSGGGMEDGTLVTAGAGSGINRYILGACVALRVGVGASVGFCMEGAWAACSPPSG